MMNKMRSLSQWTANLRSGPILPVLIHSLRFALPAGMLLQSETKIEPDLRLVDGSCFVLLGIR